MALITCMHVMIPENVEWLGYWKADANKPKYWLEQLSYLWRSRALQVDSAMDSRVDGRMNGLEDCRTLPTE